MLAGAAVAWVQASSLLYRVAPTFRAVKQGPPGFPLTVSIDQAGLGVRNNSEERWPACRIDIGTRRSFESSFELEPHGRVALPYLLFSNSNGAPAPGEGYIRARELMMVRCLDDSGRTHLTAF